MIVAKDWIKKSAHCFESITQLRTPSRNFLAEVINLDFYLFEKKIFIHL